MEIARRCKVKICVTQAKFDVMKLLPWPEDLPLEQLFTTDPHSSPVHVVQWNWLGETWCDKFARSRMTLSCSLLGKDEISCFEHLKLHPVESYYIRKNNW